ncbi:hypothetical protein V2J09_022922 [Rumex salicifolius]
MELQRYREKRALRERADTYFAGLNRTSWLSLKHMWLGGRLMKSVERLRLMSKVAESGYFCIPPSCNMKVVAKQSQYMHAIVGEGAEVMHLIIVYACPTTQRRAGLWDQLSKEVENINQPLLIGDFNVIRLIEERLGGFGDLGPDSTTFNN